MQTKHIYHEFSQIFFWSDLVTFFYTSAFLSFFYYTNQLSMGKCFDNYIVFIFAFAEVIKYIIYAIQDKSVRKNRLYDFFKSILVLITIFIVIYVVAVLFGAPVFSHFQETATFSLITTTVTALPTCMYLGPETANNMFLSLTSYEADNLYKLFMLKIRLSLFGAWLGAFVIPLDWNRPWQVWPVPCCVGVLMGYTLANCITSFLQFKRRKPSRKTGKYTL